MCHETNLANLPTEAPVEHWKGVKVVSCLGDLILSEAGFSLTWRCGSLEADGS